MTNGTTHLSSKRPGPPSGADFALYIEFEKGAPNPQRVFQAADAMIRALQRVDKALCAAIDTTIEPIMVLEEIEAGSLKIWLKDILTVTDDEALKTLDWKPAIGKYLVRAKYAYIQWANKKEDGSLIDLARHLRGIAAETDVKHFPDYAPPSIRELANTVEEIDAAKGFLSKNDKMTYIAADGADSEASFDLTVNWSPEELIEMAIKEWAKFENMPMTLIIKRPDYLGTSMWDFRHGKQAISAKIADQIWLGRFHGRQIDVRPGDALKCLATLERGYGHDNELVKETITITRVEDVLPNMWKQIDWIDQNPSGGKS